MAPKDVLLFSSSTGHLTEGGRALLRWKNRGTMICFLSLRFKLSPALPQQARPAHELNGPVFYQDPITGSRCLPTRALLALLRCLGQQQGPRTNAQGEERGVLRTSTASLTSQGLCQLVGAWTLSEEVRLPKSNSTAYGGPIGGRRDASLGLPNHSVNTRKPT